MTTAVAPVNATSAAAGSRRGRTKIAAATSMGNATNTADGDRNTINTRLRSRPRAIRARSGRPPTVRIDAHLTERDSLTLAADTSAPAGVRSRRRSHTSTPIATSAPIADSARARSTVRCGFHTMSTAMSPSPIVAGSRSQALAKPFNTTGSPKSKRAPSLIAVADHPRL